MTSCWCGYTAPCSMQIALHMVLVHGDGEVALTSPPYSAECMHCFYDDLAPYALMPMDNGLRGAAMVGKLPMLVPSGRGPQDGMYLGPRRGEEV
jgi:hypothetical protein